MRRRASSVASHQPGRTQRDPVAFQWTCRVRPLCGMVAMLLVGVRLFMDPPDPGRELSKGDYAVNAGKLGLLWRGTTARSSFALVAPQLESSFSPSQRDATTDSFLADCRRTAALYERSQLSTALQRFLGWSRPRAQAAVNLGTLFIASPGQFRSLFAKVRESSKPSESRSLLDVGAGTGAVTETVAEALGLRRRDVTALEVSATLRAKLADRRFRVVDSLESIRRYYDVVALLNVLDRCDDPVGLVRRALERLKLTGVLLIAAVVPFCDRVREGALGAVDAHRPPRAPLPVGRPYRCGERHRDGGPSFEVGATGFLAAVVRLEPTLRVVSWTRLPYLSCGDTVRSHYVLHSAVFVLRREARHTSSSRGNTTYPR
mmetsp:Transcript_934/g.2672  ORF Transcript_934/g.2672 Transcript_934/m.2672 type:complete len:375 (+) Transcript_934:160-1284(+)